MGKGELHLVCGPMFAGKTSTLIEKLWDYRKEGKRIGVLKPIKDTRYSTTEIVSHNGVSLPCTCVEKLNDFPDRYERDYRNSEVIGIDEGQFFEDLIEFSRRAVDVDGKIVIVVGLDGCQKRKKFGRILDLVPDSDSIVKLNARCGICNKPAPFTFRTVPDSENMIGGAESYTTLCRECHAREDVKRDLINLKK